MNDDFDQVRPPVTDANVAGATAYLDQLRAQRRQLVHEINAELDQLPASALATFIESLSDDERDALLTAMAEAEEADACDGSDIDHLDHGWEL
jgi:hypothetical protein